MSTHIVVVAQGALGDCVLLWPLFRSLRARYPGATLTIVTRPNLGQMLTMMGATDAYASAEDREHSVWFTPADAAPDGAGAPNSVPAWAMADVVISGVSNGKDAWAENARRARHQFSADAGLHFFEPRPSADYGGHITQWHRTQLAALQLDEPPATPLRVNPDGAILIHPGSGGDAKCWPRDKFLSLGRTLKRLGFLPTFVLGEAEQEKWGRALINELKDEFPWNLHMGLYELAERIARARMYLGNDSGVTHLAAAMDIPVLALFGPSNEVQWRPMGAQVKVLRAPAPQDQSLAHLQETDVLAQMLAELRKL